MCAYYSSGFILLQRDKDSFRSLHIKWITERASGKLLNEEIVVSTCNMGSQDSNESVLGSEIQPSKHDETIVYK